MAKNAASVVARHGIDKILKINMCAVIGAVRNRSDRSKRHTVIVAHLRHRCAFHFDRQRVVPGCQQHGLQRQRTRSCTHEAVTTDDQPVVNARICKA